MNRTAVLSTIIALTMATGQFAFAQNQRFGANSPTDTGGRRMESDDRRAGNPAPQAERRGGTRMDQQGYRRDNRGFGRSHDVERSRGRGVGPNREYYRGDRLPSDYRHRNYVVNDWRTHKLSAPPRGYQWVQSGGDYVLIAIASGIIAQILLDHRY